MAKTNKKEVLYDMEAEYFDKAYNKMKESEHYIIMKGDNVTALAGNPIHLLVGTSMIMQDLYDKFVSIGMEKAFKSYIKDLYKIIKDAPRD